MTFAALNIGQTSAFAANYAGATAERDSGGVAASVTLTFNTDGSVTSGGAGANADVGLPANWYLPTTTGIGSSYWVKSVVTSGSFTSDPSVGTWVSLSTVKQWQRSAGAGASQTVVATFSIASDSSGVNVLYTGSITMIANGT